MPRDSRRRFSSRLPCLAVARPVSLVAPEKRKSVLVFIRLGVFEVVASGKRKNLNSSSFGFSGREKRVQKKEAASEDKNRNPLKYFEFLVKSFQVIRGQNTSGRALGELDQTSSVRGLKFAELPSDSSELNSESSVYDQIID